MYIYISLRDYIGALISFPLFHSVGLLSGTWLAFSKPPYTYIYKSERERGDKGVVYVSCHATFPEEGGGSGHLLLRSVARAHLMSFRDFFRGRPGAIVYRDIYTVYIYVTISPCLFPSDRSRIDWARSSLPADTKLVYFEIFKISSYLMLYIQVSFTHTAVFKLYIHIVCMCT